MTSKRRQSTTRMSDTAAIRIAKKAMPGPSAEVGSAQRLERAANGEIMRAMSQPKKAKKK